jgi:uncharacterized protein YlxW (UPF0749 family)
VSTPVGLLDAIVAGALDPSYAEAAQHREQQRLHPSASTRSEQAARRWIGAGLMVAAGAIAGLAVSFQHKVIPQVGAARSALVGDAGARTNQVKALEKSLAAREREIADLQRQRLQATETGRQLERQSSALSAAVAQTALEGPGVMVTVADLGSAGVVTDRDLQAVVNALWAGRAEAISVGGVRLGPQTAIRTAGQTILADFKALRSPYVVAAIGGPSLVAAAQSSAVTQLAQGPPGTHPAVKAVRSQKLVLPAAGAAAPSIAGPLGVGGHS